MTDSSSSANPNAALTIDHLLGLTKIWPLSRLCPFSGRVWFTQNAFGQNHASHSPQSCTGQTGGTGRRVYPSGPECRGRDPRATQGADGQDGRSEARLDDRVLNHFRWLAFFPMKLNFGPTSRHIELWLNKTRPCPLRRFCEVPGAGKCMILFNSNFILLAPNT